MKSIKEVHQKMILPEKQNIATDNKDPVTLKSESKICWKIVTNECDKRRLMMKENLIEYRSMLKANMSVLDSLC